MPRRGPRLLSSSSPPSSSEATSPAWTLRFGPTSASASTQTRRVPRSSLSDEISSVSGPPNTSGKSTVSDRSDDVVSRPISAP